MGHGSDIRWWDDLIDEFQDQLVAYYEWGLERIAALAVEFEAVLVEAELGSAEHERATDAVAALSRAAIRLRGQLNVAREIYDRGLGPISSAH